MRLPPTRWPDAGNYRVAMIGFTPGWSYLSGLDESLHMPRRQNPRLLTPAGTVSIGGVQTGVQCLAGPSGWHLLGRTPVRTYQLHRDPTFLLEPGECAHWHRVDAAELWLWHAGQTMSLSMAPDESGPVQTVTLGPDVTAGHVPQALVPPGQWQMAMPDEGWALVSCVVSPGFEFSGWEMAPKDWTPGNS
jgi:predicted cupin superfamily sugar epimerase